MICLWIFEAVLVLVIVVMLHSLFTSGLGFLDIILLLLLTFTATILLGHLTGSLNVHILEKIFTIIK